MKKLFFAFAAIVAVAAMSISTVSCTTKEEFKGGGSDMDYKDFTIVVSSTCQGLSAEEEKKIHDTFDEKTSFESLSLISAESFFDNHISNTFTKLEFQFLQTPLKEGSVDIAFSLYEGKSATGTPYKTSHLTVDKTGVHKK